MRLIENKAYPPRNTARSCYRYDPHFRLCHCRFHDVFRPAAKLANSAWFFCRDSIRIVVVTAEPLPSRLASLALGTGDIDCVYHFALRELQEAVAALRMEEEAKQMLRDLVDGLRLKDISDLPLDLAI